MVDEPPVQTLVGEAVTVWSTTVQVVTVIVPVALAAPQPPVKVTV